MNLTKTLRFNREFPMPNDVKDLNSILMDSALADQPQRLSHLNRTRPRRSNVTKPTTSNPQAKLNSINEDYSERAKQCTYDQKCENSNLKKSIEKDLNIESILKQPKIK